METFTESEMSFSLDPLDHVFQVDSSPPHQASGKCVKMIDFYKLVRPNADGKLSRLWLVEAKKSTPRANANNYGKALKKLKEMKDKPTFLQHKPALETIVELVQNHGSVLSPLILSDFDMYMGDICEKFSNGLALFFATRTGRHSVQEDKWPDPFRKGCA
jgi:hypothetical protein